MHRVYVSTGAFIGRPNGRDFKLIPEIAPKISCDGFELMFYTDWYGREEEIAEFLNGYDLLSFPRLHVEKTVGELLSQERFEEAYKNFSANCRVAKAVGARLLIMHLWNGPISDSNIEVNFSAYPRLEEIAGRFGLTLTVENVVAHYSAPLKLLNCLMSECPQAKFTYDTKMAEFDRENEVAFSPENVGLWRNVRHLHINDRAGERRDWSSLRALNIGEGTIDFDAFFDGLRSVGYSGDFTVEANAFDPQGELRLDKLNACVSDLRRLIARYLQIAEHLQIAEYLCPPGDR